MRRAGGALLGLALGIAAPSVEASMVAGKVANLYARSSDQLQIVELTSTPTGRPACVGAQRYYAIRDENSRAGQAQFATLLSAQVSGKRVEIVGTDACTRWVDAEDILYVRIID